jgi:type II secretion system protein I
MTARSRLYGRAVAPERRAAAPEAGFTLIEVLVALAILSLAVVASIQGFAQGLRLLKLAGDHQQAMLLADHKMREIVEPKEGREQGTEGLLWWERTTRLLETPDLTPAGGAERARVYEIDVRVVWEQKRQLEIRTLKIVFPESTQQVATQTPPGTPSRPGAPASPFGTPSQGTSPGPTLFRQPGAPR